MVKKAQPAKKTIGILGGMGPEATVNLFNLIVSLTKAEKDNEHIPIIIINNPKIPDRTDAIINDRESPLPSLIKAAQKLEKVGADFIVMPCITAHYYYHEIKNKINIPLIHMIKIVVDHLKGKLPDFTTSGLLATTGTIKTELFQKELAEAKYQVIIPDPVHQIKVMEAIYGKKGIKAGFKEFPLKILSKVAELLKKRGAQAIIAGCTEIALVIEKVDIDLPTINPLQILASASIKMSGYQEK